MTSSVFGAVSTAGALSELLDRTGGVGFAAVNQEQQQWLELLPDYLAALPGLSEYVTSMSAPSAEEVNLWLAERGFPDLRLEPWAPGPDAFGVAAVCDVLLTWIRPGRPERIIRELTPDVVYPAVEFGQQQGCTVLMTAAGQPVVVIISQQDLQARIMISDRPASRGDLLRAGRDLLRVKDIHPHQYTSAVVPMVHLEVKPDLSWLIGLHTSGPGIPAQIVQAVQQVRFGLNRIGARVMEATAMAGRQSATMPKREAVYRVDQPFLLTISRTNVDVPIVTAWVDVDSWSDPGDLSRL